VTRYVVDASVVLKWFVPEIHSEAAVRLQDSTHRLHAPAFLLLELGSVVAKKIRRGELSREEGEAILKNLWNVPLQRHPDERLFRSAYALALETRRSLYDCLYLALAGVLDSSVVTADRKFHTALSNGPYRHRILWVEDLPIE
jgi:predicted nucleic acid-binding protein